MTIQFKNTENDKFNISREEALKHTWTGESVLPEIGAIIRVTVNNIGIGKVIGYLKTKCNNDTFTGVIVDLYKDTIAEWYLKQNGLNQACIFGPEFKQIIPGKYKLKKNFKWSKIDRRIKRSWKHIEMIPKGAEFKIYKDISPENADGFQYKLCLFCDDLRVDSLSHDKRKFKEIFQYLDPVKIK